MSSRAHERKKGKKTGKDHPLLRRLHGMFLDVSMKFYLHDIPHFYTLEEKFITWGEREGGQTFWDRP